MTKTERVKQIASKLDFTQSETEVYFDTWVDILSDHLAKEEGFSIPGFGTFSSGIREAYRSYNPHYKQNVMNPKKRVVYFSQSTSIKKDIDEVTL